MTMQNKPINSFDELIARATAIAKEGRKKTVAVAAAQDADVIGAVAQAHADGFIDAILVGNETAILKLAKENNIDIGEFEVINKTDINQAAHQAVKLASEKKADLIMKGFLPTSALLRTVLDKQYGLRGKTTLSHCAVLDIPGYHKLLNFTDGGMVVKPDQEEKLQVLENAITVGRALGLSPVKVAVSAAVDRISDRMPHTLTDNDYVIPEAMKKFEDIAIQGPLTFDLATSSKAAGYYTSHGPVVGDADIFLVDSIEECNVVSKALIQFAQTVFAGVIVGAKVPISLVSRTDTVKNKKASLAIACVLADYYDQSEIWKN
ncbi:MAG: phosphate acyltransferase [candidate division Zixibacteria bacterium]|nr:phosphate acyltransferase [candidate division Zixibacteria bacterium]